MYPVKKNETFYKPAKIKGGTFFHIPTYSAMLLEDYSGMLVDYK